MKRKQHPWLGLKITEQHQLHRLLCRAFDLSIYYQQYRNLIAREFLGPSGCSIPDRMSSSPSAIIEDFPSESQNEGDNSLGEGMLYNSCAFRRKYIVKGF